MPLPDLHHALREVVQYLDNLQRTPPTSMSIFELKKMQWAMQFCLYMLIPPVRNNYAGLRFVTPAQETEDELTASNSPNYILVKGDGSMELVFNKYKIDGRSAAVDYDPMVDFRLDGPTTRRLPLDLYKNHQLFDPSVTPGDSLDMSTRSLKLVALATTVAWGRGLPRLATAEEKLSHMVGPEDATISLSQSPTRDNSCMVTRSYEDPARFLIR